MEFEAVCFNGLDPILTRTIVDVVPSTVSMGFCSVSNGQDLAKLEEPKEVVLVLVLDVLYHVAAPHQVKLFIQIKWLDQVVLDHTLASLACDLN